MNKQEIRSVAEKNRIIKRISDAILDRDAFLLLGHRDPDTDCIASLVGFALLLSKFSKKVTIFLAAPVMAQFSYLLAICKYNGIAVEYGKLPAGRTYSAAVILDTPKPEMIAMNDEIASMLNDLDVLKIEIDHHLAADAAYSGDKGYCLVSEASSTCELIGFLLLKMSRDGRFDEMDLFSRNLALSVLTGIIGDSQMGKYLKTRKEKFYYKTFSEIFDRLLVEKTRKNTKNLNSMEAVFDVIMNFSVQEKHCFEDFMARRITDKSIYYVQLNEEESAAFFENYGDETVVNVSKAVADTMAEDCGTLGLLAYYDRPDLSDFIQFRLRRSAKFLHIDLRKILTGLGIENGGGHPGAIGFRVKKGEVSDSRAYASEIVERIEKLVEIEGAP